MCIRDSNKTDLVFIAMSNGSIGMYSEDGSWVSVARDGSTIVRSPTPKCGECDPDCTGRKRTTIRNPDGSYLETSGGKLAIHPGNPTACVLYLGISDLHTILLGLRNNHNADYIFNLEESGQSVYQRRVRPGEDVEEELSATGTNRYTFRISLDPSDSQSLPAEMVYETFQGYGKDEQLKLAAAIKLKPNTCLLYTSPSPRDRTRSRMPSSA